MRIPRLFSSLRTAPMALGIALLASCAHAPNAGETDAAPGGTGAPHAASPAAAGRQASSSAIEPLAWLSGCWRGSVNQREFREEWMPVRGELMLGVTQTVTQGRTQDFAYLRIEPTPEGGLRYVVLTPGQPELTFRYVAAEGEAKGKHFAFASAADTFPERIVYQRGEEGWLYASAEGRIRGEDKRVTYPMRRIGCESGETLNR